MMKIDERRDSPRIPVVLGVRFPNGQKTFQQTFGTVSLGGVDFVAPDHAPKGELEVEVLLPAGRSRIRATAKPLTDRVSRHQRRITASFVGLDVKTELHLARWMQRVGRNKPPALG